MNNNRSNLSLDIRHLPVLEEPEVLPEIKRPAPLPRRAWTKKRVFYRTIMTGAIFLNPLVAYFLFQSIIRVRDLSLQEVGLDNSLWANSFFTILAVYFTVANVVGDPPAVNPIEESEELIRGADVEEANRTRPFHILDPVNRTIAVLSFIHFAADNAIAISGLTGNNRTIYLGLGIPFTIFSAILLFALAKNDLDAHTSRFILSINTIHTAESSLRHIVKSPLISLEVSIEVISNIAFQGIAAGYISDQLVSVFDLDETDPMVIPWILTATALSAYTTTFTRVLPVYDLYFKPEYETITRAELKQVKLPLSDHLHNIGIALTRAGTMGWLIYRFGPGKGMENTLLVTGLSLTNFIHPTYVLYQQQKHEAALVKRHRDSFDQEHYDLEMVNNNNARTPPEKIFDEVAKRYNTPRLRTAVTIINVSARIGQLLSFLGFVTDTLQTLNANGYTLPLNFSDTIALAILWGTPIAITEGRMNQGPLVQAACYHQAKYLIGAPTDRTAKKNIITRTLASFFCSKNQFSAQRLANILRRFEYAGEEEMVPLLNR